MERLPILCPRSATETRKPLILIAALPLPFDAEAPSLPQSTVGSASIDSRLLSAFHFLFVIILAHRQMDCQTSHGLSYPDTINHQPTNRLLEAASHRCPRQCKTDQAKNTPTGSPPPITTDFRSPWVGTVRTRKITTNSCPSLEAGFGSDFCRVFLPERACFRPNRAKFHTVLI